MHTHRVADQGIEKCQHEAGTSGLVCRETCVSKCPLVRAEAGHDFGGEAAHHAMIVGDTREISNHVGDALGLELFDMDGEVINRADETAAREVFVGLFPTRLGCRAFRILPRLQYENIEIGTAFHGVEITSQVLAVPAQYCHLLTN